MVRLHLLGPPEALAGGSAIPLAPKLLALLAYVAVAAPGGLVRRDVLLAVFWPDSDVDSARNALNQSVYELRRQLGRDSLESRGKEELVIGPSVFIDVRELRALLGDGRAADALELYRGDLLEGLHISGAWPFERWLDETRHRIRRRAAEAAAALASAEREKGRLSSAISWLVRAFDLDPTDETIGRALILAHLGSGDRASAARVYHRLVTELRAELGIEPAPETLRLAEVVRSGDRTPDATPAPTPVTAPAAERRIAWDLVDRAGALPTADGTANAVARELLTQATRIDPQLAPARTGLASALADWVQLFGGPRSAALQALTEADAAVRLDPGSPEAHVSRGCALEALTRFDAAAQSFRDAVRIRPRHPEAVSRVGRALMYAGHVASSRRIAGAAVRQGPEDPDLLLQLGMADFVLNREDEGRESTSSALRLRPGAQYARAAWGFYEIVHGRFDEAEVVLGRLLDREPDSFVGHFMRGDLALAKRDFGTALRSYQRCYDINPSARPGGLHLSARAQLGTVHVRCGDLMLGRSMLERAEADVMEALNAGAGFGGFFLELAIVAAGRGQPERAVKHLTAAYRKGYLQYGLIRRHPAFDELRRRPDYRALLAAMQEDVAAQRQQIA